MDGGNKKARHDRRAWWVRHCATAQRVLRLAGLRALAYRYNERKGESQTE